jgi:hypothetical protein
MKGYTRRVLRKIKTQSLICFIERTKGNLTAGARLRLHEVFSHDKGEAQVISF